MDDHDKLIAEKIATDDGYSADVSPVELKGEDDGRTGILKRYVFVPNPEALKGKSGSEIKKIVEETLAPQLWKDCKMMGWWPSDEAKPYRINHMDDGSWMLVSFLESGKKPNSKFLSEFDQDDVIGINEQ